MARTGQDISKYSGRINSTSYILFAQFLVECGIDSISLNPDSVIQVKKRIAKTEQIMGNSGTS
jgi:hypothetical protein